MTSLQPDYVRIDHIYDFYDIVSKDSSGLSFDWTKLNILLSDIKKTGATPFISLSYMPPQISSGNEVAKPNDWNDWENTVRATIQHISGTLAIDNVYYEVWNEPDLFGEWKLYGDKNYLELYESAARGAARANNVRQFSFGGVATTALYKNWFVEFVKYARSNNLRLDFYSWHKYNSDPSEFESDIQRVNVWAEEEDINIANLEFIISESGHDAKNNALYDSKYAAVHTLSTIAALDGQLAKLFSFEIKDGSGPSQYWGRWGILTHERYGLPVKKPRYDALVFANKMTGDKVNVTGTGSWVKAFASNDGNKIKLLVVNFDNEGKHDEAVPLQFVNLPAKKFVFRKVDFQGGTRQTVVNVEDDLWSTIEYFPPNTASLFELEF